ncbi:MAG: hypothetical protein V7606_3925 [Burkholderiales bacterium]
MASYGDDEQHVRKKKEDQALCSAPAMACKIVKVIPARYLRHIGSRNRVDTVIGVALGFLRQPNLHQALPRSTT